jgi:hypothetical protein
MHTRIQAGFIFLTIGSYAVLLTEIKKAASAVQRPQFAARLLVGADHLDFIRQRVVTGGSYGQL